jgi:lipoprotein NlpD
LIKQSHLLRRCYPFLAVVLVAGLFHGCTSSWQAPLETRGTAAKSPPAKARPALTEATSYRVRPGDTLYGIAWNAGTDWRTLAAWNRLAPPYVIHPGQTLRLKPPPRAATPPAPAASKPRAKPQMAPPAATPPPPASSQPRPPRAASPPRTVEASPAPGPLRWQWPTSGQLAGRFVSGDPARKGIKIAGREGQGVEAAEGGRVVYSGSGLIGYGRLIIIKHNDKYLSAYGHNRKLLVKEGDRVTKGERIAEMGVSNSGRAMLHFEIRQEGKPVDPLQLLPRR